MKVPVFGGTGWVVVVGCLGRGIGRSAMCITCLEMVATWVDSCWTILASADTSVDVAGSGESLLLLLLSSVSKGVGMVSVVLPITSLWVLEAVSMAFLEVAFLSFSFARASNTQLVSPAMAPRRVAAVLRRVALVFGTVLRARWCIWILDSTSSTNFRSSS